MAGGIGANRATGGAAVGRVASGGAGVAGTIGGTGDVGFATSGVGTVGLAGVGVANAGAAAVVEAMVWPAASCFGTVAGGAVGADRTEAVAGFTGTTRSTGLGAR